MKRRPAIAAAPRVSWQRSSVFGCLLGAAALAAPSIAATPIAGLRPPDSATGFHWRLPRGFPEPPVPRDNPMSELKLALGRRLFFEARLSITGRYSCASCHDPALAYSDGRPNAIGATGSVMRRNAMALVNLAYNTSYGWSNSAVRTLEAQMRQPLFNDHPVEIGLRDREAAVLGMLRSDSDYTTAFAAAFPSASSAVSIENMIKAIAAFERTLLFGDSAFDRYVYAGEHTALDAEAKLGMRLFYSARLGCANCHSGFNFTGTWNEQGHPPARPASACNGASDTPMRIPTLRNIALSAPYMHDGSLPDLRAVIAHYEGIHKSRRCRDRRLRDFTLDRRERAALLAFLRSLTSPSVDSMGSGGQTPPF